MALAVRAAVKLPTASYDDGLGTGKLDLLFDLIGSRELQEKVDDRQVAGLQAARQPRGLQPLERLPLRRRRGFPSRSTLQVDRRDHGRGALRPGPDVHRHAHRRRRRPARRVGSGRDRAIGSAGAVPHQEAACMWARRELRRVVLRQPRRQAGAEDSDADRLGLQVRLGLIPRQRRAQLPAASASRASGAGRGAAANRPPTVKARCEPCTVQVAPARPRRPTARIPDGDTLRYKWDSPTGSFGNANDRQTPWTAPGQVGAVPRDGDGGRRQGRHRHRHGHRPGGRAGRAKEYTFEDVHFDFDRYSLRPDATRILDEAIKAMQDDADLRIDDRRPHLQHRHDRVQPRARRAPRQRGARLPRRAAASTPTGCRP